MSIVHFNGRSLAFCVQRNVFQRYDIASETGEMDDIIQIYTHRSVPMGTRMGGPDGMRCTLETHMEAYIKSFVVF